MEELYQNMINQKEIDRQKQEVQHIHEKRKRTEDFYE